MQTTGVCKAGNRGKGCIGQLEQELALCKAQSAGVQSTQHTESRVQDYGAHRAVHNAQMVELYWTLGREFFGMSSV